MKVLLEKLDELRESVAALLTEARGAAEAQRYRRAGELVRQAELLHNEVANLAAALAVQHEEMTL